MGCDQIRFSVPVIRGDDDDGGDDDDDEEEEEEEDSLIEPCLPPEVTVWNRWVQGFEISASILFCSVPHPAVGLLFDRELAQTQTPCCTDA
ncbi:hypothetical protein Q7C36_010170 [Tachysurus vachellii]|uniref:Uncharacterized protein n=1 Tax=Tachysurus vachellii TaxID=175792 RepID=A0AA88MU64_TACVA|nr:hypothetical protein Q7C36_010170 [Tachysurus vachellii]